MQRLAEEFHKLLVAGSNPAPATKTKYMDIMAQEKMNVTLAKAEHERAVYSESLRKQGEFFKRNPSSFRGEKKTFHAAEGQLEDPTKMGHTVVATTVSEEIKRLVDYKIRSITTQSHGLKSSDFFGV